jgi:hypothetical protein
MISTRRASVRPGIDGEAAARVAEREVGARVAQ